MFKSELKYNVRVLTLLITLLCFFEVVFHSTGNLLQADVSPAGACCKEDINEDGNVNILDVIALVLLGISDPENPVADYNGNGYYSIADAVKLLISVRLGTTTPLETFSLAGKILENDLGLEGVLVRIKGPGGSAKTTTDSDGLFSFENLCCGTYVIWCKKAL